MKLRAVCARLMAAVAACAAIGGWAQPYPTKPIRIISPFPPGGTTDVLARIIAAEAEAAVSTRRLGMGNPFAALALAVSFAAAAIPAWAQYPTKPIRIIVTFAAGGTADILSRAVGAKLAPALGQPVIADNRPGAGSVIGSEIVAKAPPDGHTIGMLISTHAVNPFVMKNLPYDSVNDFIPITLVAIVPGILSANANLPVHSVQEMVELVRSKPGQYNYGLPGSMTSGHLSMELLKVIAGLDMVAVPYKGGAPAAADLAAGQVQFMINSPPTVLPFVKAGKVRALAVTGAKRSPGLPDLPTISESGFPDYETYEWYGLFAPAKVPKETVARLGQEVAKILKDPELRERMLVQGAELVGNSPEEFARFVRAEMEKWGALARKINLRVD